MRAVVVVGRPGGGGLPEIEPVLALGGDLVARSRIMDPYCRWANGV
jgi:hypothetical protein